MRVDILERLADLIRPAIAYRPGVTPGEPPAGAADQDGFVVTGAMTSLVGCAGEDFASILRSLGYVSESRPGPAITVPLAPPPAATEPAKPVVAKADDATTADEAAQAEPEAAQAESETAGTETIEAPVEAEAPAEPAMALNERCVGGE